MQIEFLPFIISPENLLEQRTEDFIFVYSRLLNDFTKSFHVDILNFNHKLDGDNRWILGHVWLRQFYTIFDLGVDFIKEKIDFEEPEHPPRIGFAISTEYAFLASFSHFVDQIIYFIDPLMLPLGRKFGNNVMLKTEKLKSNSFCIRFTLTFVQIHQNNVKSLIIS